jgi:Zn-dependent oligopeptidase
MKIYQKLFNIKFYSFENEFIWHSDVRMFCVNDGTTNALIGHFYLDLFKRNGKYDQIRCFSLQNGCANVDSSQKYQHPISALISSFNKPSKLKPTLLSHGEVVSFFHEFGHVIHQLLGQTKYSLLSGTNVEDDFVETPAQVLENLCWTKEILNIVSSHYITKKSLPNNIIDKMVKMRNLNVGLHYKKHILISIYDQLIHSSDNFIKTSEELLKIDDNDRIISMMSQLFKQLHQQVFTSSLLTNKITIGFNDGIFMPSSWINFIGGVDARYYGYLWSKVLSSDIYMNKFYQKDIKNAGYEFKKSILEKGGSASANSILKNYLKRNITINGFIKLNNLGLGHQIDVFFNTENFNTSITKSSSKSKYSLSSNDQTRDKDIDIDKDIDQNKIISTDSYNQNLQSDNDQYTFSNSDSNSNDMMSTCSNRFSEINNETAQNLYSVNDNLHQNIELKKRWMKIDNSIFTENTDTFAGTNSIFIKH